jgi:hypothetical protein
MWIKKGHLFKTDKYASIPYAYHMGNDSYRIFYSARNSKGQAQPYYIDAIVSNGNIELTNGVNEPILEFGKLGTFDDCGIMPSCIVKNDNKIFMYYIGWNPQVSVSYRLSIGLAISEDGGNTFYKYSDGPLLDRSLDEPYFNTAPFVIKEDIWKMWYVSCTEWITHDNKTEPVYKVKYATSFDGIKWDKQNITCIDYTSELEAIGRPCVINNEGYEMYFSYRKAREYRSDKNSSYKLAKAKSTNGIDWFDYELNFLEPSNNDWDSNMMEYCHVFKHNDISYMLYNGNHFGKTGFGYAIK